MWASAWAAALSQRVTSLSRQQRQPRRGQSLCWVRQVRRGKLDRPGVGASWWACRWGRPSPRKVGPSCCCPRVCPALCPVAVRASSQESLPALWATCPPSICRGRVFSVLDEEVLRCLCRWPLIATYHQWLTHDQRKPSAGAEGTDDALIGFGRPACRPEISTTYADTSEDSPACEAADVHHSRQRHLLTLRYPSPTAGCCVAQNRD